MMLPAPMLASERTVAFNADEHVIAYRGCRE